MCQSELKVKANRHFELIYNDAQRIGEDSLITVYTEIQKGPNNPGQSTGNQNRKTSNNGQV